MDIQNVIEILSNFDMQVTAKADGAYQSTIGEKACKYAVEALKELQQYRQIGTVYEFRVSKPKVIAQKAINANGKYVCPVCGGPAEKYFDLYCSCCGQALKWGD